MLTNYGREFFNIEHIIRIVQFGGIIKKQLVGFYDCFPQVFPSCIPPSILPTEQENDYDLELEEKEVNFYSDFHEHTICRIYFIVGYKGSICRMEIGC